MDYAATHYINSSRGFTQVRYFKNNTTVIPTAPGVTMGSSASSNSATVRGFYNQGAGWINYSAHGSATSWGTPNFTTTHIASMTNNQKFGLMIGNCCLTNKFETTTCFGEALLRKDNYCGAVGYIGGSNSTYWGEDFYWAVGLRSSISASMSMAYNSANLGAYDRLCHTHGEPYSQWALTQGAVMMVGNLAVESSTSSRKLYYWEIYHLMGDPSVMTYLTQASVMPVTAPSVLAIGATTLSVSAVPYAYVALTDTLTRTLVASAFADNTGNAVLSLPATLFENRNSNLQVVIYYTQDYTDYDMFQFFYGDWSVKPTFFVGDSSFDGEFIPSSYYATGSGTSHITPVTFGESTFSIIQNKGLVLQGHGLRLNKVVLNDPTGISTVTKDPSVQGKTYSIDGREVKQTNRPGVYIINGKKYMK